MKQDAHPSTTARSHNIYIFKHLADRYRALSVLMDATAFAFLMAATFILLEAVAW